MIRPNRERPLKPGRGPAQPCGRASGLRAQRTLERGVTLLELMVTVAVVGILATLAAPSFDNALKNRRATGVANDLLVAANLAKTEAIKLNLTVQVCASTDGATCATANDWAKGWIVRTSGGTVVRRFGAVAGSSTVKSSVAGISFFGSGQSATGVATLDVCSGGATDPRRRVQVLVSGHASVLPTSTAVTCP